MISKILAAFALMALCVVVHAVGVASVLRWVARERDRGQRFRHWTWLFVRLATWMIVLHMIEITVWAWYYTRQQAMPDLQTAIYFSATTYTTTGYGDVVLPVAWRLVGSVEALTGILMCGWSTGFFFAVVSRIFAAQTRFDAGDTMTHLAEHTAPRRPLLHEIRHNPLLWLLVFVPVVFAAERLAADPHTCSSCCPSSPSCRSRRC